MQIDNQGIPNETPLFTAWCEHISGHFTGPMPDTLRELLWVTWLAAQDDDDIEVVEYDDAPLH